MKLKKMKVKLTGVAPLLLHNNQAVDPMNYYAKEIKKVSGKRNKTEADHEKLSKLEFYSGLYLEDDGEKGIVIIPSKMLRACLIKGARKNKTGKLIEAGVYFPNHSYLEYDGPKDPDGLWAHGDGFVFRTIVKVRGNSVTRTRPKFDKWWLVADFEYDSSVVDNQTIMLAWEKAGLLEGIGDWRPHYGRFGVKKMRGGSK